MYDASMFPCYVRIIHMQKHVWSVAARHWSAIGIEGGKSVNNVIGIEKIAIMMVLLQGCCATIDSLIVEV